MLVCFWKRSASVRLNDSGWKTMTWWLLILWQQESIQLKVPWNHIHRQFLFLVYIEFQSPYTSSTFWSIVQIDINSIKSKTCGLFPNSSTRTKCSNPHAGTLHCKIHICSVKGYKNSSQEQRQLWSFGETDTEGWVNKVDGHMKESRRCDHFSVFKKCVLRGQWGIFKDNRNQWEIGQP